MTPPLDRTFAGKSVFVTGHTGFKGSWLALWLARLGARVTGYALPPPDATACNFVVSRVAEHLSAHHEADIRDRAKLTAALDASQADVVFHLAAQPLVRAGYAGPHETFDVNVGGTTNLLEAVRTLGKPCAVVVITTDKCYENREHVWGYRESDPLGGFDPYSASKAAAELVVASYRQSFFPADQVTRHGVGVATARAGNVIGGGDWAADRVVTELVRCSRDREPALLRNPRAVRPWQHVLEPLSGYLLLAGKMLAAPQPRWCEAWNFGPLPGDELPVHQLAETFFTAWGDGQWRDASDGRQPHEAAVLRLCIDKAIWQLGWRPRWNVAEAVTRTAHWYKKFCRGTGDMTDACLSDIAEFEQSALPGRRLRAA